MMHAEWSLSRGLRGDFSRECRCSFGANRPEAYLIDTAGHPMGHHGPMTDRSANVDDGWRAIRAAAPATPEADGAKRGRLTFLGHSTVLIEIDDLRILTDPVLREGVGPVRRQVRAVLPELFADLDAVFISHGHHDHLDLASLRRIPGKPTLIVPKGFGQIAAEAGARPGRGGRARRSPDHRPRPVRGHVRGSLRPARAVRPQRPGHRLRDRRARGPSTSRATRTCFPRWASSSGGWTSRCCRCGAGVRGSARATWIRSGRPPRPRSSGRGSPSRSTGAPSIRPG